MEQKHSSYNLILGSVGIFLTILLGLCVKLDNETLILLNTYVSRAFILNTVSPWLFPALFLTSFGGSTFVATFSITTSLWLVIKKHFTEGVLWLSTVGTAWVLSEALKYLFAAERPLQNLSGSTGFAYPSGHATAISALTVLILFSLNRNLKKKWYRHTLFFLVSLFALGVSLSRIALGAHWLSDVAGGILLGGSIALVMSGLVQLSMRKNSQYPKIF